MHLIGLGQWILLPGLLIWSMNRFAVDANNSGDWVARTFDGKRAQNKGIYEWIFGAGGLLEMLTIGTWDKVLKYSTPLFQLAEGFCSLLVIQASGQITRWLVNRGRSDTWMVRTCPSFYRLCKVNLGIDWATDFVRIYHLKLWIFPFPHHQLP